jgi:hypothetical protein
VTKHDSSPKANRTKATPALNDVAAPEKNGDHHPFVKFSSNLAMLTISLILEALKKRKKARVLLRFW